MSEVQHAAEVHTAQIEQYLTFRLGDEEYGVSILQVQEIKSWENVTTLPRTQEYILGVINLRGAVIPIVDLRVRFGLPHAEPGPTTVVIVLNVHTEDKTRKIGVVVDSVSEVHDVAPDDVKLPPDFGCSVDVAFVKGLVTRESKMIILLDMCGLLDAGLRESLIDGEFANFG